MYNETLRRNSHSSHEEPSAKTLSHPQGTSPPHPSSIVPTTSRLVLQPFVTVSRSSTHTSPANRRADPRRDAFEGWGDVVSTDEEREKDDEQRTCVMR